MLMAATETTIVHTEGGGNAGTIAANAATSMAAAVDPIKTESRWGIQSIVSDDEAASVLAAAAAAMLDESLSPR